MRAPPSPPSASSIVATVSLCHCSPCFFLSSPHSPFILHAAARMTVQDTNLNASYTCLKPFSGVLHNALACSPRPNIVWPHTHLEGITYQAHHPYCVLATQTFIPFPRWTKILLIKDLHLCCPFYLGLHRSSKFVSALPLFLKTCQASLFFNPQPHFKCWFLGKTSLIPEIRFLLLDVLKAGASHFFSRGGERIYFWLCWLYVLSNNYSTLQL